MSIKIIKRGAYAGVVGGIPFGMMMGMIGMTDGGHGFLIGNIASRVRSESTRLVWKL